MTAQDEIERRKREIANLEAEQQRCAHNWDETVYDPRKTGGYQTTDHHGWRPSEFWVPEVMHPRWRRRCKMCGLVQHTEKTKAISRAGVIPGTTATENLPDFGEERRPTMRVP
jgi:hypothetical protein